MFDGNLLLNFYDRLSISLFPAAFSPSLERHGSGRGGWSLALLTFSLERMPLQARHARSEAAAVAAGVRARGGGGANAAHAFHFEHMAVW